MNTCSVSGLDVVVSCMMTLLDGLVVQYFRLIKSFFGLSHNLIHVYLSWWSWTHSIALSSIHDVAILRYLVGWNVASKGSWASYSIKIVCIVALFISSRNMTFIIKIMTTHAHVCWCQIATL